MTAYNRQEYIAEAIKSVLASDYVNFELIIVDDASTDNTLAIARSFAENEPRIKVYRNDTNLGDYPNRNKAASLAKGKYIKYVDSDDMIYPHSLAVMVQAMEKFPGAGFGFCDVRNEPVDALPKQYSGKEALQIHFLKGGFLLAGPCNTIINREFFNSIEGFDTTRFIGDYATWLKMCLHQPVVIFKPALMWLRSHQGQENDVGKLAYYHLNYTLHRDFISSNNKIFTKEEQNKILYNYRVLLGRRIYQRLLKWYGLKKTIGVIQEAGESLSIFLWAFLPMKKLTTNDR